jgi:hypothetical protein
MIFCTRIILFALSSLMLSHYVPYLFWILTDTSTTSPYILYSNVKEQFVFYRFQEKGFNCVDEQNHEYTRSEFDTITPMSNYRQLYYEGRLPESLNGVKLDVKEIEAERTFLRLKPKDIYSPSIDLYTVLDNETGSVGLEMPQDFLRLNEKVEFLNARTNSLETEKSQRFQDAFNEAGVLFPIKGVFSNPNTRKPYDEGSFIVDAENRVFHLKQVKQQPEISLLKDFGEYAKEWDGIVPEHILVAEQGNKELRCAIIDTQHRLWLVVGENFRPVLVPFQNFDPTKMELRMNGSLLHVQVTALADDSLEAVAFDRDYNVKRTYTESWATTATMWQGKISDTIFPWTTNFRSNNTLYTGFYTSLGNPFVLVINVLLALVSVLISIKQGLWDTGRKVMSALILLCGIFGFIAYWFIPTQRPSRV